MSLCVSYLGISEGVALAPLLGHLATIGICITLSGELELDAGGLGRNLLGTSLLGLLSLTEGLLVAELVALAPLLGHLAAVGICITLSGELELDAGGLVRNFLGTSLLGLLPDASPLGVTERQALTTCLSFAPGILPGGHRT